MLNLRIKFAIIVNYISWTNAMAMNFLLVKELVQVITDTES